MNSIIPSAAFSSNGPSVVFLAALYGDFLDQHKDEYIPIRWRSCNSERVVYFDSALEAGNFVCSELEGMEVHSAIAPRRGLRHKDPRLLKTSIDNVIALHVDVDREGAAVEKQFKQLNPSVIIHSGYGFRGLWFVEAIPARTYGTTVERLNKCLTYQLDGDYGATDISHQFRLPGTLNLKFPNAPRPVEIIDIDPSRRFPLEYYIERFNFDLGADLEQKMPSYRPSNAALFSPEQSAEVSRILAEGLYRPQLRNDATMLLVRYCDEQGINPEEAEEFIIGVFDASPINMSKDWKYDRRRSIQQIRSAIASWPRWKKKTNFTRMLSRNSLELAQSDEQHISSLSLSRKDLESVEDLLTYALNNKRDDVLFLQKRALLKFRNVHSRNYKDKIALFKRLGLISLKAEANPKLRKAPEYFVLYAFSQPSETSEGEQSTRSTRAAKDQLESLILAGADTQSIRAAIPGVSRQQIHYHRNRLNRAAQDHYFMGE